MHVELVCQGGTGNARNTVRMNRGKYYMRSLVLPFTPFVYVYIRVSTNF